MAMGMDGFVYSICQNETDKEIKSRDHNILKRSFTIFNCSTLKLQHFSFG